MNRQGVTTVQARVTIEQIGHDCTGTVVVLPDILADARFNQTLESSESREGGLLNTQSPVIISCSFTGLLFQQPPVLTFSYSHFYNCSAEREEA